MPAKIDGRTKAAVLRFIAAYDAKNGRGGVSAASRKFKVTRVTISRWLTKNPSAKKQAKPVKAAKAAKAAKVAKVVKTKKRKYTKRTPKAAKVVHRRGRRPSAAPRVTAFARGLVEVAALQAKIANQMLKLASVVA
jgi:hypothetical protein